MWWQAKWKAFLRSSEHHIHTENTTISQSLCKNWWWLLLSVDVMWCEITRVRTMGIFLKTILKNTEMCSLQIAIAPRWSCRNGDWPFRPDNGQDPLPVLVQDKEGPPLFLVAWKTHGKPNLTHEWHFSGYLTFLECGDFQQKEVLCVQSRSGPTRL